MTIDIPIIKCYKTIQLLSCIILYIYIVNFNIYMLYILKRNVNI